jgi:hypothetical protein
MRPEAFERVELLSVAGEFPIQSAQTSKRWSEVIRLALLAGLAGVIVLPQIALALYALSNPETRALILDRPLMTAELATALVFWIGLFAWPLRRLHARVNGRRNVEISRLSVTVRDEKLMKTETWSAPLATYTGISHRVRASLSGSRHELILVHPDKSRSVLLMVSEHISEADIQRFTRLLGLPQIPARQNGRAHRPVNMQELRALPARSVPLAQAA